MHILRLCVLHLHIESKAFCTVFEAPNMKGPIILGRMQVKAMGYVKFQQIEQLHAFKMFPATLNKICTDETPFQKTPEQVHSQLTLYQRLYMYTRVNQVQQHNRRSFERLMSQ